MGRAMAAEIKAPDSAVHCKPDTADSSATCSKHSASGKSEAAYCRPGIADSSAKCSKHSASGKSKARPDTADSSAKCSEHSASGNSEAIAERQRFDHPHHWLEVTANHLKESAVVAKRKALARELMGEEANKPM